MKFIVEARTVAGLVKNIDQDSLMVKRMKSGRHQMVLAVVCDGMGGGSKGELASASVVKVFNDWANNELQEMIKRSASKEELRDRWTEIVNTINAKMVEYGHASGIVVGTTATVLLIIDDQYFVLNVGDSRVYKIRKGTIQQITVDQTIVEREVRLGIITPEQAAVDTRRNILLQSVGASTEILPDMFVGDVHKNSIYIVCSDGFYKRLSSEELNQAFAPELFDNKLALRARADELIQICRSRGEKDDISVVLVKTY